MPLDGKTFNGHIDAFADAHLGAMGRQEYFLHFVMLLRLEFISLAVLVLRRHKYCSVL